MTLESKPRTRWVLMILLGIVGSGLWELAAKPLFAICTHGILIAISGFGRSQLNAVYTDVARGPHEHAAQLVLILVASILFPLLLELSVAIFAGRPVNFLRWFHFGDNRDKSTLWIGAITATLIAFFAVLFLVRVAEAAYIDRAISHFEYLVTVVRPYVSAQDIDIYRSEFAQVQSRDDYVRVVTKLEQMASAHHCRLPEFRVY